MNHYEIKQAERKERLEAAAERAKAEAERAFNRAHDSIAGIPPGQPILVGHHSERRHRRDLERHDNAMRRGFEAQKRAEELAYKAAAAGSGGISSDDPEAVDKIRERVAKLEAERDMFKRFNAAWRKAGRPRTAEDDWSALRGEEGFTDRVIESAVRLFALAPYEKAPIPGYALSNLGANIRRLKGRIAQLEREAETPATETVTGEGWETFDDEGENRVGFKFDGKPSAEVRGALRSWGFRWAPSMGRWQRHRNNAGRCAVEAVVRWLRDGRF